MNLFRNLRKDEIEVRRGRNFNNGKCELLLYKTARTDYNLLDETFGYYGWACQYKEENGILFCGLGIQDPASKVWIWRWNAGSGDSNFEKEKSAASDSLKRVGFAFGLGRELYSAPRIVITPENDYEDYSVSVIEYDGNNRITTLVIADSKGNVVFNYVGGRIEKITDIDPVEVLTAICSELRQEGEDYKELGRFFNYYKEKIKGFDNVNAKTITSLWKRWNKQ